MLYLLGQYSSSGDNASGAITLIVMIAVAWILGAWSANAAERKGIPRSTGWILGIFLGVLGRIIVGLMRDRRVPDPRYLPPRPDAKV